jgi:hypothetical protein
MSSILNKKSHHRLIGIKRFDILKQRRTELAWVENPNLMELAILSLLFVHSLALLCFCQYTYHHEGTIQGAGTHQ